MTPSARSTAAATDLPPHRTRALLLEAQYDAGIRGLTELGLTVTEARAYLALLDQPLMTAANVATRAGIARPKVYEALRLLEDRGFCKALAHESATVFRPVPPTTALPHWVRQREHDRHLLGEREAALAEELAQMLPHPEIALPERRDLPTYLEAVVGRTQTADALEGIIDRAKSTLLHMTQPPWMQPRSQWNEAELRAVDRGVAIRTLYPLVVLDDVDRWQTLVDHGVEVRFLDEIPMKLVLRDAEEAMVSLRDPSTGEQSLSNVLISHRDLVAPLAILFEQAWSHAQPLGEKHPAQPTEDRKRPPRRRTRSTRPR
jgi:HTH-type transcriptional regulator, sugar sensing transcriptional regulator